ncbi:AMP-binding protein [Leisingera sp. D0M16]|uniref:AMP-binding protein n=1 Tax=Leisingera coralii TaxID=3351347 RepID=UPI003B7B09BE
MNTIRDLTVELHPEWRKTLIVRGSSDLDRNLGFDSLARAELLLRIKRDFNVRLADQLIVEAATASDIIDAVAASVPDILHEQEREAVRPIILPESHAPEDAQTLLEILSFHVNAHSQRPHVYLWHSENFEEQFSYAELDDAARMVAQGLIDLGVAPGERVAIMLPTSLDFFRAFFGVVMAGAVPVPVYPPLRRAQVEDHLRRQAGILKNAEAVVLITDELTGRVGGLLYGMVKSLKSVRTVAEISTSGRPIETPFQAVPSDTALIQYTSGSTGDPKGVLLSHANLLANIRAMGTVMEADSNDIFVSWLPLYHDMGLIGAWLGSLYYGVPAIIMPPLAFIADPARWLWAIHRHRATLSAAPNFAFELCLKRVADEDIKGLDLSSLRMVVNGAEPVSPSTIARFTERFSKYGFAPTAMAPVYGLAESSVGLAFPPPRRMPIVDRVERHALAEQDIARPAAADDPTALEIVACGQPLPGHQVRIVDDTGREAPERHEGRLEFKGPSVTRGYFRNPEKNKTLFKGDWADSGDLAYIFQGDVYLTGRVKDVIIRAGRNVYPHELEECVGDVAGVRKGCVAVIAGTDKETATEKLIVVAETRLTDPAALADLETRILEASASILEIPPEEIVLVPPHAVPKTSSGKIRRSTTREFYETGTLGQPGPGLWWQLGRLTASAAAGRLMRGARTVGRYAFAGWWWSVLLLLAVFVWPLVVVLPVRRWRHTVVGGAIRTLFRLTGIRFGVERLSVVPERDIVIVANHASYLDGGVLSAAIDGPLTFVVTERFARQIVAGPFLRRLGAIFVADAPSGLREAEDAILAAVRAGERLVVFPEGRLRRMPGLLSFYPGAFHIAARAGVPVVPVTLAGTRSILRDSRQWFPRRAPVSVHVSDPMRAEAEDFAGALDLGKAVRAEILAHCQEPDLSREQIEFGMPRSD